MGLLVGCYSPTLPENQPCSETQNCPEGLVCDLGTNECVSTVPETARFVKLSSADENTCGIDQAGALFCWGRNERAELGLGDQDDRLKPTRVGVESDWLDVRAGVFVTCGLRATDQLWCWGDSPIDDTMVLNPRQVAGAYTTLTVGQDVWCAIDTGGALICHRRNEPTAPEPIPTSLVPVQIAANGHTACAIDTDQQLWCWGDNAAFQVGTGDNLNVAADAPNQIQGRFQVVEMGDNAVCAITTGGELECWGNCGGQIGRNDNCGTPTVVEPERKFRDVSVGGGHTCAIDVDGKLHCAGNNNVHGELGTHGGLPSLELLEVEGFGDWTSVSAGTRFTCGLRADQEAWCWGDNRFGQLGDRGGGDVSAPVEIDPGPFDAVFAGSANGCALRDGALWCWGSNSFGQLGDNTTLERRRPVQIGSDTDWAKISIRRTQACGIRTDSTLWCWGNNSQRQLGIGGNLDARVPTQVGDQAGWTEIAVADETTCGVRDGVVLCWGARRTSMPVKELDQTVTSLSATTNSFLAIDGGGALAFSPFMDPTPESTLVTAWDTLDVGQGHACGLIGSELWCYGLNNEGQLGRMTATGQNPDAERESTNGSFKRVSAGDGATCAISMDDKLVCWGRGVLNGLGEDTNGTRDPTIVGSKQWLDVSVGDLTTCGIQVDGSLHCWGFGVAAGRGDGKGGHERPTRVAPP